MSLREARPEAGWVERLPALNADTATVSVVLPLRNEGKHIRQTLDAVVGQTFPRERLQIVAVDGMSTDSTPDVLAEYERGYPNFRVVSNPGRTAPRAMNRGIAASDADLIVRVDGHCVIAPDYVEQCVRLAAASNAANVGGRMRPRGRTMMGRAIGYAMSSPFGMGNGRFHYLDREEYVDTVYLGAFRREVLDELGGYDEDLTRNQDDELNYRIRAAGHRILLSPAIVSTYTPRESLPALWRQYHGFGFWKVRVMEAHPGSIGLRHLAPPALVLGLAGSLSLLLLTRRKLFAIPLAVYALFIGAGTLREARQHDRAVALLPAVFPTIHIAYGVGFVTGALALLRRRGGGGRGEEQAQ